MNFDPSKLLLPCIILKLVLSANNFYFFYFPLGFIFFLLSIVLAIAVLWNSNYRVSAIIIFLLSFLFFFLENLTQSSLMATLKFTFLNLLFLLAGAKIFISNPKLIFNQLIVFFLFCIPIMILQISGASSIFMYWNVDYLHSPEILTIEELGTFKIIDVYPTLFRSAEDIYLLIGQGRPVGLLHSNNILSYMICVALAFNVTLNNKKSLVPEDYILTIISVLTMSLTVMVVYFLSLFYLIINGYKSIMKALSLTVIFIFTLFIYYLFFPGVLESSIGESQIATRFFSRFYELAFLLGFYDLFTLTYSVASEIGYFFDPNEETPNLLTLIIRNNFLGYLLIISIFFIFFFLREFYKKKEIINKIITLKEMFFLILITLLIQISLPFLIDHYGMLFFGFALSPFFIKSLNTPISKSL